MLERATALSSWLRLNKPTHSGADSQAFKCRIMSAPVIRFWMDWHPDAQAALKKDVPFFVRPAVRKRVEAMAEDSGVDLIQLEFYNQAKASMAPK